MIIVLDLKLTPGGIIISNEKGGSTMSYLGKVCVVTGGANGIGRCIVESFLTRGASVAFIDVDNDAGLQVAKSYPAENVLFYCGDITEVRVLEDFTRMVKKKFNQIDYLINNACISKKGILSNCSYNDFNYVLKLGVSAPYMLTKLFSPSFSKDASIVNISSTRALMSQADTESYTAAKGGITALTHALSISLAGKVRVNAISPGWIDTRENQLEVPIYECADEKQHPAGRVGTPEDIANMVLFLCSEKAGFITGENIVIDGGMTKQMIYHNDCGWSYMP